VPGGPVELGLRVRRPEGFGERLGQLCPDVRDAFQLGGRGPAGGRRRPEPVQKRLRESRAEPGHEREGDEVEEFGVGGRHRRVR
jgi:hypothetical protein